MTHQEQEHWRLMDRVVAERDRLESELIEARSGIAARNQIINEMIEDIERLRAAK